MIFCICFFNNFCYLPFSLLVPTLLSSEFSKLLLCFFLRVAIKSVVQSIRIMI